MAAFVEDDEEGEGYDELDRFDKYFHVVWVFGGLGRRDAD